MRIYTAHLRADRPPVLVAEGFSWGALIFGGLWLLFHRAWIAGLLAIAASVVIGALTRPPSRIALELGLAVLLGLVGRDLVRWSLDRRGFVAAHVITARNAEQALGRLLNERPDMGPRFLPPEVAR